MKVQSMSLKDDVVAQAALATPPSGVVTLTLLGYDLNHWIMFGTAVLIVLQIGFLLHKWVAMVLDKESKCRSDKD